MNVLRVRLTPADFPSQHSLSLPDFSGLSCRSLTTAASSCLTSQMWGFSLGLHSFVRFLFPCSPTDTWHVSQQDEGQESLQEELDVLFVDDEGEPVSCPAMVCPRHPQDGPRGTRLCVPAVCQSCGSDCSRPRGV